jgi:hypothetical protein
MSRRMEQGKLFLLDYVFPILKPGTFDHPNRSNILIHHDVQMKSRFSVLREVMLHEFGFRFQIFESETVMPLVGNFELLYRIDKFIRIQPFRS